MLLVYSLDKDKDSKFKELSLGPVYYESPHIICQRANVGILPFVNYAIPTVRGQQTFFVEYQTLFLNTLKM